MSEKRFRVVVERAREAPMTTEVREMTDVPGLLTTIRAFLRDAAATGKCVGFTVTVHPQDAGCDHEL